jgi:cytochrome c5
MNFNYFLTAVRARAGMLLPAGVTAAAAVCGGIGDARSEQEITPRDVYYFACAQCHQAGLNAAPKYGNKKAWSSLIEQGREKMYENTMKGKGAMPPKGGKPNLTDEQVKMAVDYMVNAAGGWPEEN